MCIEYCRGSSEDHKYVAIDTDKCKCATGISFDPSHQPSTETGSTKLPIEFCGTGHANSIVGSVENNAVSFYNIEYNRAHHGTKLAPTTCRVYEHELFYTQQQGFDRFTLQYETGRPPLKAKCLYKSTGVCQYPLLQSLESTRFKKFFLSMY